MVKLLSVGAACLALAGPLVASAQRQAAASAARLYGRCDRVAGRASDQYTMFLTAGQRARVWAVGDGDIDLAVKNPGGREIVADRLTDHEPECSWTAAYTGSYTIVVENAEPYTVGYCIESNNS